MKRVVLDTNVYISSILFGGKPEAVWQLAKAGRIKIFASEVILAELCEALRKKFDWENKQIEEVIKEIRGNVSFVTPREIISVIKEHKTDNCILECALEAEADFLVSGDKHLLTLKNFKGINILSPSDFLEQGLRETFN